MTTRILLTRHGQTHGNVENLFCGHAETALTPLGIAQAQALGRRLKDTHFDAAYASDLSRAADTASYIIDGRDLLLRLEPDLREMHYGEWEALPASQIRDTNIEHLREFFRGNVPAPGGETIMQLRERTARAVRNIASENPDSTVLVVSHGNAIMALIAELLGVPEASSWSFSVANTSLSTLHFSKSGRFTLVSFNDAAHIEGLPAAE